MPKISVNREGGDTIFYSETAGVATEIMRVTAAGNMSVPGTLSATVGVVGIGSVPVGAIMPILRDSPITGGGYAIPSTGTVDASGWMLCDGAAIPASQTLTGVTPNLSNGVYLRGFTTSGGALGGSNSFTIGSANLPTHTHGAGTLINACVADHAHSGASLSGTLTAANFAHSHSDSIAYAAASHSHCIRSTASGCYAISVAVASGSGAAVVGHTGTTATSNVIADTVSHSHTKSGSVDAVASAVDRAVSVSGNTGVGGTHNHLISGSTDSGSFANTAMSNEPQYMNVRYLIRVK